MQWEKEKKLWVWESYKHYRGFVFKDKNEGIDC